MDKSNLQEILDEISESIIKKLDFDISNNKIQLFLETLDHGEKSSHLIEFNEVSAFYFTNNVKKDRKTIILPDVDDYLECTSILLLDEIESIKICTEKEIWLRQYDASANVAIEVWNKILLIEAQEISVDSIDFKLE